MSIIHCPYTLLGASYPHLPRVLVTFRHRSSLCGLEACRGAIAAQTRVFAPVPCTRIHMSPACTCIVLLCLIVKCHAIIGPTKSDVCVSLRFRGRSVLFACVARRCPSTAHWTLPSYAKSQRRSVPHTRFVCLCRQCREMPNWRCVWLSYPPVTHIFEIGSLPCHNFLRSPCCTCIRLLNGTRLAMYSPSDVGF